MRNIISALLLSFLGVDGLYNSLTNHATIYAGKYGYLLGVEGGQANFSVCEAYCLLQYGTQLGSIYNAIENADIKDLLTTNSLSVDAVVGIGLEYDSGQGAYEWTDGIALDYTNWDTGEPNTANSCVTMSTSGKWKTADCTGGLSFCYCNRFLRYFSTNYVVVNSPSPLGDSGFLNITAATNYCLSLYGNTLAIIRSSVDQQEIADTIGTISSVSEEPIWISLNDNSVAGKYVWANGIAADTGYGYENWATDEPNSDYHSVQISVLPERYLEWETSESANYRNWAICDLWIPTPAPTFSPTRNPTPSPTAIPTKAPTDNPTKSPTKKPTEQPTKHPTKTPTTKAPTKQPTKPPTKQPTKPPTKQPTKPPTKKPTKLPTKQPTKSPTNLPSTKGPTSNPTKNPTNAPSTKGPTSVPTKQATTEVMSTSSTNQEKGDNTKGNTSKFPWYYILIIILAILVCLVLILLWVYAHRKKEQSEYQNSAAQTHIEAATQQTDGNTVPRNQTY